MENGNHGHGTGKPQTVSQSFSLGTDSEAAPSSTAEKQQQQRAIERKIAEQKTDRVKIYSDRWRFWRENFENDFEMI